MAIGDKANRQMPTANSTNSLFNENTNSMENPANNETLLARWLEGSLNEAELEALQKRADYEDLKQIIAAAEGFALPEFDEVAAFEKLKEKLATVRQAAAEQTEIVALPSPTLLPPLTEETPVSESSSPPPVAVPQSAKIRRLGYLKYVLAAAAAIALLLLAFPWATKPEQGCRETAVGEHLELKLPDGSDVVLNAVSEICFPVKTWKDSRLVELEGEAYFRVKKGRTFTVRTDAGEVKVVGTIFNVFARGEELTVQCADGKVQVSNEDGTQQTLIKAGEGVTVLNGRLQPREGLRRNPTWFKGESSFQSAPVLKVFEELERQYMVNIQADSIDSGRTFTGKFVHKDLAKALKMVCDPMNLQHEEIEVDGKKVLKISPE